MRKQADYLAGLLGDDGDAPSPAPRMERGRGTTLLNRETALARVASGEVRQVTQLLLDPAQVRVWRGNARSQVALSEATVRDLIDSMIAEGGQKVPAVVRRVEDEPGIDYEVVAGTRRLFAVRWLRDNHYPDMRFLAQVADIDDEAAFRLADLENRARRDVSDMERARNYAEALQSHYGGQLGRMAERLKLSKGWLSKLLRMATLPDVVVAAFPTLADIQPKPAYALAQALDGPGRKAILGAAEELAELQKGRRSHGIDMIPADEVARRLLAAPVAAVAAPSPAPRVIPSKLGRPMVSFVSANRQGVTLRFHAGAGGTAEEIAKAVETLLRDTGKLKGMA